MRNLAIAAVLGVIAAVVAALALVSGQAAADLRSEPSILTIYGER